MGYAQPNRKIQISLSTKFSLVATLSVLANWQNFYLFVIEFEILFGRTSFILPLILKMSIIFYTHRIKVIFAFGFIFHTE